MNHTLSDIQALAQPRPAASAPANAWNELVGAMPIVILYRAVREALQRRAHRHAVLQAFRR